MRVQEFAGAHSFLERTRDFLFKDETAHNLLLSAALALSKTHSQNTAAGRALRFLAVVDETQKVVGAALRTPQARWILAQCGSGDASQVLTQEIQNHGKNRSVMLPVGDASQATLNFMAAAKVNQIDPAPGFFRLALSKDLTTLILWSQRSAKESGLDESACEAAESIEKYLEHRQLFVWENEGRLKAMAAIGGFTPKTTRISQVYTDITERSRGYAATLTHRLTHKALTASGAHTCVLLADAKNPITKHVYEKIGYRTKMQYAELRGIQSHDHGVMVGR